MKPSRKRERFSALRRSGSRGRVWDKGWGLAVTDAKAVSSKKKKCFILNKIIIMKVDYVVTQLNTVVSWARQGSF